MLLMELQGNLRGLVAKIEGLEAVLNEPISGAVVPASGITTPISSGADYQFNTVGEFLNVLDSNNLSNWVDGIESFDIQDGVVRFKEPVGSKG